jgi:hypothetical protein
MRMPRSYAHFCKKLYDILKKQFIITSFTVPLLAYWGISISVLTIIGNIIFAPVLAYVLCLGSCLFFCELAHIPNTWLITLFEKSTALLTTLLQQGPHTALWSIQAPSFLCLCSLWIGIALLLHARTVYYHRYAPLLCGILLLCVALTLYTMRSSRHTPDILTITDNTFHLTVIHHKHSLTIIDTGTLGKNTHSKAFIEYTVLSALRTTYGTDHIDQWITLYYTAWTFDALIAACTLTSIKTVYIPGWQGNLQRPCLKRYFHLRRIIKNTATHLCVGIQKTLSFSYGDLCVTMHPSDAPSMDINVQRKTMQCCVLYKTEHYHFLPNDSTQRL